MIMDEYIKKNQALCCFSGWVDQYGDFHEADEMIEYQRIEQLPAADVVPVRHGRWETDGMMMDDGEYLMTRCTACGEAYEYGYNMPFCPNCGAKMDGDQ